MATWPTTLPSPLAAGYGVSPVDPCLRTPVESGAALTRRVTYARNDQISVAWLLTDAQMAIFRDWFDDPAGANGGASWFNTTLMLGTGGTVAVEARFAGVWKKGDYISGNFWRVSAQLEVR